MNSTKLTQDDLARLNITGWPFLHEQGYYICRGFVRSLMLSNSPWTLEVYAVETFQKSEQTWRPQHGEDAYSAVLETSSFSLDPYGQLLFSAHGMETYVGPNTQDPWSTIDWPELDGYAGGPMDLAGLSKRALKRHRKTRGRR
jgi:hypothetical protein